MVDNISSGAKLPDDFGVQLDSAELLQQVHSFLSGQASTLDDLRVQFENNFPHAQTITKKGFQLFLYSMIDDATATVKTFLDTNATQHSMLPDDIDKMMEESGNFLKEHGTIDISDSPPPNVYRGKEAESNIKSKGGIDEKSPDVGASAPPSGGLGASAPSGGGGLSSLFGGGGGEGGMSSQIQKMIEEMTGGGETKKEKEQKHEKAVATYHKEVTLLTLCADFAAASNPLDKGVIYQELTQELQGQAPKYLYQPADIRHKERENKPLF